MNVTQRFTLLVKGSIDAVLVKFEDPERSLNQLVLDMEDELESAKRAVARAMANEDRLRSRIAFHEKDMKQWQEAAERTIKKDDEDDAREMLRRLEQAERQRELVSPLEQRVQAVVDGIRAERNLAIIFDVATMQGIAAVDPQLDLTPIVVQRLQQSQN